MKQAENKEPFIAVIFAMAAPAFPAADADYNRNLDD